jgi:hypothetical protein
MLLINKNYPFFFFFQVFPFFGLIRFRNVQCSGINGQFGTCFSRQQCASLGGTSSGSCARNWGTCCVSKCAFLRWMRRKKVYMKCWLLPAAPHGINGIILFLTLSWSFTSIDSQTFLCLMCSTCSIYVFQYKCQYWFHPHIQFWLLGVWRISSGR